MVARNTSIRLDPWTEGVLERIARDCRLAGKRGAIELLVAQAESAKRRGRHRTYRDTLLVRLPKIRRRSKS